MMRTREAFGRSLFAALALASATAVCAVPAAAQQSDYELSEVDDGVYRLRYETHNTFFVVSGEEVIAFDPLNEKAASAYAEAIRSVAPDASLRFLVYSHHHADHATGAPVLFREVGDGAPIVAHRRARPKIVEAGAPNLPPPEVTFGDSLTLHLGDQEVELHYLGKSHSDNLIVALLPERKIAFAVDFVAHNSVGYRELSSFYFPEQFRAMERLQELDYDRIVFGHGPSGDRSSVARQIEYYRTLRDSVRAAVERGWTEDRAAKRIELPAYRDWRGYEQWFSLNVRGMYREITRGDGSGRQ